MDSGYETSKIFKFNLITPRSKEEISTLERRDNTLLYSFILIFASALIFFLLSLFQNLVVTPQVNSTQGQIDTLKAQIATYDAARKLRGELFVKALTLEPILAKDIKMTELLSLGDAITSQMQGGASVVDYARESTGEFVLTFVTGSFKDSLNLMSAMASQSQIQNIFLRSVVRVDTGSFLTVISFKLVNS